MTPSSATSLRTVAAQDHYLAGSVSSLLTVARADDSSGEWARVGEQFARLPQLEPDWDGDGALRIDRLALSAAAQFAAQLRETRWPAPAVVPLADGGVQLEWWRGERRLEIEFDIDGDIVFVCDDPNLANGLDGQLPGDERLLHDALIRTLSP